VSGLVEEVREVLERESDADSDHDRQGHALRCCGHPEHDDREQDDDHEVPRRDVQCDQSPARGQRAAKRAVGDTLVVDQRGLQRERYVGDYVVLAVRVVFAGG